MLSSGWTTFIPISLQQDSKHAKAKIAIGFTFTITIVFWHRFVPISWNMSNTNR